MVKVLEFHGFRGNHREVEQVKWFLWARELLQVMKVEFGAKLIMTRNCNSPKTSLLFLNVPPNAKSTSCNLLNPVCFDCLINQVSVCFRYTYNISLELNILNDLLLIRFCQVQT